jgi:UDP-N-acetylmuramoyl-L-alanyl-D-glutamate--2,6-diaminopimelate ligase
MIPAKSRRDPSLMPNTPLSEFLSTLDFAWRREPSNTPALTNIQWRANACDIGSILFFQRFDDGRTDAELWERYLAEGPFSVLVTNRMLDCFDRLPGKGIYVTRPDDWAEVVSRACDLVYPLDRGRKLFLGVTGTNGKTTTVKYLEAILSAHGRRVLSIGTLGVSLAGERLVETGFTSPPLIELRRLLHEHGDRYDVVAMEVSSHALDQGRTHGIPLQNAAWTNFTQDHLDYHHHEEAYFKAKARVLEMIQDSGRLFTTSAEVARRLLEQGHSRVPVQVLEAPGSGPRRSRPSPFWPWSTTDRTMPSQSPWPTGSWGPSDRADWRHLGMRWTGASSAG